MVKEKPPEKPKAPEKPKVEPPKVSNPKSSPRPRSSRPRKRRPRRQRQPTVAPPAAELPSFVFEGGKTVETSSDPVQLYKGLLEYAFRSKWNRPQNLHDDDYVAEVRVTVDREGHISNADWLKGSGNTRWDDSVRRAVVRGDEHGPAAAHQFPAQRRHSLRRATGNRTRPPVIL